VDDEARERQERLHQALVEVLDLDGVLTGWILVTEELDGDTASAGHFYGPDGMTTWRALGLIEWARANTLKPDEDDG
jgi:hypothetical protein